MSNATSHESYLIVPAADISCGICLKANNSTRSDGSLLMGHLCDHPAIIYTVHSYPLQMIYS